MSRKHALVVLSVLALAGCPTRSKDIANDGGGGHDGDGDGGPLPSIQITSPASDTYSNGSLTVTVETSDSARVSAISIYLDQETTPLKTVSTPYTFSWDTTKVSEGPHTLIAKATVNNQDIASSPVIVHVDRTPPTFTSTPAANSLNVALSDPITVVFSESLDPTSVTNAAVALSSGISSVSTTLTLGTDMKTITIVLGNRSSLSFPATITESVAAKVTDLAGNAVGTTPSWSWTAPLWVKLPVLAGDKPTLALDPQGRAIVTSLVETSSTTQLSVVRYAPGATWDLSFGSPPIAAGLSVGAASVAVDSDGAPTVAWSQDHVYAASWNGAGWVPLVGNADAATQASPNLPYVSSIALDAQGTPYVAWSESVELNSFGYVATWANSAWQLVPAGMQAGAGGATLLVNSTGTPVGLFPVTFGNPQFHIEIYEAGSWLTIGLPANTVSDGSGMLYTLALDSRDEPVTLVETLDPASSNEVLHVEVLTSSTWVDMLPSLSTYAAQDSIGQAYVALGNNDQPFILWSEPDATGSLSLHLARQSGTAWDTTYGVLDGISAADTDATYETVVIDKFGTPTVAWTETDPSTLVSSVYLWKSNY